MITNAAFAFELTGVNESKSSFVDIGLIREDAMRDKNELVWLSVPNQRFWSSYITGMRFRFENLEGIEDPEIPSFRIDT